MSINGTDTIAAGNFRDLASVSLQKTGKPEKHKEYDANKVVESFNIAFMYIDYDCGSKKEVLSRTDKYILHFTEQYHDHKIAFKLQGKTVDLEGIASINLETGVITSKDLVGGNKKIKPSDKKRYADVVGKIENEISEMVKKANDVSLPNGDVLVPCSCDYPENTDVSFIKKFVTALEAMK